MKKFYLFTILLTMISATCYGQNENSFRDAFTLKLAVDSTRFYQEEIGYSKYFVKEGVLQIYPGENLFIETETDKDSIISMKVVKENKYPSKTIVVKFRQELDGRIHNQMILEVLNPFDKELRYDAMMYVVGHDKWLKTSIIPVHPKLASFELWNDKIITLVLFNWRIK